MSAWISPRPVYSNEIFHIKEMVYLNIEANYGLWNYISAHFSMITQVQGDNYSGEPMAYLFEDSEITETISILPRKARHE